MTELPFNRIPYKTLCKVLEDMAKHYEVMSTDGAALYSVDLRTAIWSETLRNTRITPNTRNRKIKVNDL
jgi:hypothetical protein